ncbi:iron-containing redox enzyme family protein [Pseudomonas abietaniphila]|uniref:TenA family transcriptional regulator n=1 Tax=Pseudomonas abietaniphila TaxID=89065 RepID=UPI003216A60D
MNNMTQRFDMQYTYQNDSDFILQELAQLKEEMIDQISRHPFLIECRNGLASLDRLKAFMVQQGKYSRHFTRYICQLMANLESNEDILHLLDNLFEEMGFGEVSEPPHSQIYRDMLLNFDLQLDAFPTRPSTQRLINTMMNFCKQPEGIYGLSALCLGAEAIVPSLYSDIVAGLVKQGVALEDLKFFTLHIECDDGHADTMLAILSRLIIEKPTLFEVVRHAAFLMIQARLEFLDDM